MNHSKQEYKTFVGFQIPISTMEKIEDFRSRYRRKYKTDAITELIELALMVESKMGLVETITNEDLEEMKQQLETRQVVDYFSHMDKKTFSMLLNIIKDEEKSRVKK